MGALEEFTKCVIDRVIAADYPHLKLPPVLYAQITKATQLPETYTVDGIVITDETVGRTFTAHYAAHWYQYTVKVLDHFGNADEDFPPIPGVDSRLNLNIGAIVAISPMNGGGNPVIIGEVTL